MFTRLKSNISEASQFDPPTDPYQLQLRDTDTINETHCHDVSSDCKGDVMVVSGLDWFHSITPSVSPDNMTSPIITSTQVNLRRKPNLSWSKTPTAIKQQNCQTEKDTQSKSDSALNHNGTVTSASEEENRKCERNENITERISVTQEQQQLERKKDEQHPKSLRFVFQKVSKNLRERRLGELELNNQQCDKDGGGGHGERVVSTDGASKNVTDVLNTISDSRSSSTLSSGKKYPSNNLIQDNQFFDKESGFKRDKDLTGSKNICTVLREKMAAEAEIGQDMHAKLSNFKFKPRKMRPSLHSCDFNASSDVSAELQAECNLSSRDLHIHTESSISKQKRLSHDELASPLTHTEKSERKKKQNEYQNVFEGGCKRQQVSCVSEVGESGSEDSTSAQAKTVGRIKGNNDTENLCQQQRARVDAGDKTIVDGFTGSPALNSSIYISDPAPFHSGHTKSTVASSTLAKLSRFSFTCTTEPTTTAQRKADKNLPSVVEKDLFKRHSAEKSKVKKTLSSPKHSPLGKKIKTIVSMGKVKDVLSPTATMLPPGHECEQGTEYKAQQTEPTYAAKKINDGPVDYESTVNLKKRKSFELGSPSSRIHVSKGPFSGLFGSVELSNDVLDTDWDQEFSK